MRLPRMTTRRWMIAVAVVALCIAAPQAIKRQRIARLQAAEWQRREADVRIRALYWEKLGELYTDPRRTPPAGFGGKARWTPYGDDPKRPVRHSRHPKNLMKRALA